MILNDIKEGPRLNLPNFNWVNQYQNKTKESKLAESKGKHRVSGLGASGVGSMISPDLRKSD